MYNTIQILRHRDYYWPRKVACSIGNRNIEIFDFTVRLSKKGISICFKSNSLIANIDIEMQIFDIEMLLIRIPSYQHLFLLP